MKFDFEASVSFQLLAEEFGGAPIMVPRTVRTLSSLLEYLPMDGSLSGSLELTCPCQAEAMSLESTYLEAFLTVLKTYC